MYVTLQNKLDKAADTARVELFRKDQQTHTHVLLDNLSMKEFKPISLFEPATLGRDLEIGHWDKQPKLRLPVVPELGTFGIFRI